MSKKKESKKEGKTDMKDYKLTFKVTGKKGTSASGKISGGGLKKKEVK